MSMHTQQEKLSLVKQLLQSKNTKEAVSIFEKIPQSEDLRFIRQALQNNRFEDAILLIEDFERQQSQVAPFYDPVISALKIELLVQENELSEVEAEHTDLVKAIDNFQVKYQNRAGPHLETVLRLRKDKLKIMAQMDSMFKEQYEAAQKEFDEFLEAFNSPIAGILFSLTDEEEIEIKRLYRKASLLCHPDRVKEEDKERAREMFEELNEAYMQNNIKKLRLMAELLSSVGYFESMRDNLDNAEALKAQIELIRLQLEEKEAEIQEVLASSAYQTVKEIGDGEAAYFEELVANLKAQKASLEQWLLLHGNQN